MADREHEPGQYVRRVADDTRRYAHGLLEENERLRTLDAARRAADKRLLQQLGAARQALIAAEALREWIGGLEPENARLRAERDCLAGQLAAARAALAEDEQEVVWLEQRLARTGAGQRRYAEELAALERQSNDLANLYVASYRLHGTVERDEVVAVLQEILANLVGSEEVALFELDERAGDLAPLASNGIDPGPLRRIPLGQGVIGRAASVGEAFVRDGALPAEATAAEAPLTACIPLRLGARVTGVIAVFHLLPQKDRIDELDREIFDLLATHAATALYLSALHARSSGQAA